MASFPEAIFVLAACLLFSAVLLLSRVRPVASDIAKVHGPGSRLSIAEGHRSRLSGSYDYDAIPTFEERHESDETDDRDDEGERWEQTHDQDQGGPSRNTTV